MYALLRNVKEFELTAMVIVRSELGFTILEIEEEEFDERAGPGQADYDQRTFKNISARHAFDADGDHGDGQ